MAYIGKSPTGTGVRSRYYYTASGGETSLSGADDNSNTLVFSDGNYVDVSLNGIALVAGTDYNTSTANTIAGLSALSASDIVEIVVYDIFTVADTVSAKNGGTFSGNVAIGGNLTVTGTSPGNLIGIQTFTADGTYTPTAGTTKVLVYVVGGGGAGGGANGAGANTSSAGGGGGGGATSIKFISTGLGSTETVTVGAGGVGNSTTNGGAGGTTSFGSHATATGGSGGKGGSGAGVAADRSVRLREGGAGGSISSGVGDVLISGQAGGKGVAGSETDATSVAAGEGGSSHLGGGAYGIDGLDNGIDAVGYGGGGGGGSSFNTTGNRSGGNGADGVVVIYEYQ
jgi:hypothetical protein